MKRFTGFCMAMFMAVALVACGGGATLDTTDATTFGKSFEVMYESLSDSERANVLYYLPAVLYKGTMADAIYKALSKQERPSDEVMLQNATANMEAFKTSFQALFNPQLQVLGPALEMNIKELNGLTAEEITEKGQSIMEVYSKE